MMPPLDVVPDTEALSASVGPPGQLAAASPAALSPPTPVPAPLHVVAPDHLAAPTRRGRFSRLAWLVDGPGWPWLRAVTDLAALVAAIAVVAAGHQRAAVMLLPLAPIALALFSLRGKYRRRISALLLRDVGSTAGVLAISTILLALWRSYVVGSAVPESLLLRVYVLGFGTVAVLQALLLGFRYLARILDAAGTPTLILGCGEVGTQIAQRLRGHPGYGLRPIGFVDFPPPSEARSALHPVLRLLGSPDDLEELARRTGARHVVITFARERDSELVPLIRRCNMLGLEVSLVPRLFESINHRVSRDSVGTLPLHVMRPTNPRSWEFVCKHVLDRTLAALGLLVLAPLLAAVALAVKLTSPGPVLFRQRRVGRDGRCFEMLKFRSMLVADPLGWDGPGCGLAPGGVEGEDRRTAIGRFLRRSSIDELPQLWNVFRGQMSLVGPRPERPEYVEQFREEVARYDDRHRVKSGITGAAQVNGLRGSTGLADRIDWDNYYIENWTLALDLRILAHTVLAVLRPVE